MEFVAINCIIPFIQSLFPIPLVTTPVGEERIKKFNNTNVSEAITIDASRLKLQVLAINLHQHRMNAVRTSS